MGAVNAWRLIESAWLAIIIGGLIAVLVAVSGCTLAQCIKPVVQIERPLLPEVQADRLAPLDDATYIDVVIRDRLMHEYAETLEVIVRELAEVTP
jgi:hypothetical protein